MHFVGRELSLARPDEQQSCRKLHSREADHDLQLRAVAFGKDSLDFLLEVRRQVFDCFHVLEKQV